MYYCVSSLFILPATLDIFLFFFFNDTATTEIYTLSLHDALPIFHRRTYLIVVHVSQRKQRLVHPKASPPDVRGEEDRKSTRLNSSHANISYAVFCLKKKKTEFSPL